jgi:predicted transcriptional regulator
VPGPRERLGRGARLGEGGGHHVRGLAGGGERFDRLRHQVVRIRGAAVLVRDLPVLVLDDEEPRELLAQLGQALADELEAADDRADVIRVGQLAAAVGELVQHRDRARRLAGDLARRQGAR